MGNAWLFAVKYKHPATSKMRPWRPQPSLRSVRASRASSRSSAVSICAIWRSISSRSEVPFSSCLSSFSFRARRFSLAVTSSSSRARKVEAGGGRSSRKVPANRRQPLRFDLCGSIFGQDFRPNPLCFLCQPQASQASHVFADGDRSTSNFLKSFHAILSRKALPFQSSGLFRRREFGHYPSFHSLI